MQKTSGLAIASLVCSLIVCIPGLGLIGLILGCIAVVLIGSSEGRVRGKGLATAAIIVGLLATTAWIGTGVAFYRIGKGQQAYVVEPSYAAFTKLDTGDVAGFRTLLSPALSAGITDAEIIAFRDAYQDKLGAFQGQPRDMKSMFAMIGVISDGVLISRLQQSASCKGVLTLPAGFSKQPGAIFLASDTISSERDYALSTPIFAGTVVDIAVASPNQPVIYLTDFIGKKAPAPPDTKAPAPSGNGG